MNVPGLLRCDLLVVGGGINGVGIARDAAGRGLSVVLCEKDDLAGHTSSASSKLAHGGLRYLEHGAFGMVRKALVERELLLQSAPHIAHPLRFVLPLDAGQRPAWLLRAGLFLYDRLAARAVLPGSEAIRLAGHPAGVPLKSSFTKGFAYSDGRVDDARLVVLNAVCAREHGAIVLPRTRCGDVRRGPRHWSATLEHADGTSTVEARCLVNAAGPWAGSFLQGATGKPPRAAPRLVKGSHIVVPRLFAHDCAYVFQHPDRRVVFALPFEGDFTLVGTTDVDYAGNLDEVRIGADETDYLCRLVNRYFVRQVSPRDVVWSYAGVRPLAPGGGGAAAVSRDRRLERDTNGAPLLSVFGGKITTYRMLAEHAVDWIAARLGVHARGWTAHACLPGGDLFGCGPCAMGVTTFTQWVEEQRRRYPWLAPPLVQRYARAYGTRIDGLLDGRRALADMGAELAAGLFEAEVEYLVREEWAACADDILWRRSKLGLRVAPGSAARIDAWIAAHVRASAPPAPVNLAEG